MARSAYLNSDLDGLRGQKTRSMAAFMETVQKLKYLIVSYLTVLIFLLLCVAATPLVIRHGMAIARKFIIEEETLETVLIAILFAVSYLIWTGFRHALKAYMRLAVRAGEEKSRLISRLAEAFSYIGCVNVEIQEIQSMLCGPDYYPQTKRELKQLLEQLAAKAMAVAGSPWIVVRMISRCSGRTIKEFAMERRSGLLPSATLGNRAILEGRPVDGLIAMGVRQKNLDQLTVCILPEIPISDEQTILITAILNQIEMFILLYRKGSVRQEILQEQIE